jgi:NTE family protein
VAPAVQKLQTSRPQLALTLAGGGARGGAHVGVLKVLEAYGIKPDLVTGASMGAVVGSLYCAGVPTAQIERMFLDGTVKKAFLPTPIPIQALKWIPAYSLQRLFGKKPQIGLYSGDRIARMMKRALPPDRQLIERFPRPFSAISVNVLDSRPVCTSKGSAPDAVRAGATVPFIYRPVLQDGKELVDGGVRANLPTHPAAASGAPVIVAVRMYGSLKSETREKYETLKTYADRILSLLLAQIESDATANADIVIEPEIPEMHLYDFDPEIEKRAIYAGEQAALKAMPKILAKLRQTEGTAAAKQGPTAGGAM